MRTILFRLSVSLVLIGAFALPLGDVCLAQGSRPLWYQPESQTQARSRAQMEAAVREQSMLIPWISMCRFKINNTVVIMHQINPGSLPPPPPPPPSGGNGSGGGIQLIGALPGARAGDESLFQLRQPVSCSCLVEPDGSISDLRLVKSSGNQKMDSRAMLVIQKASPFPRPRIGNKRRLVITFGLGGGGGLDVSAQESPLPRTDPHSQGISSSSSSSSSSGTTVGQSTASKSKDTAVAKSHSSGVLKDPETSSAQASARGEKFMSDAEFDATVDRLFSETDLDLISEFPNVTRRGTTSPAKLEAVANSELTEGHRYLACIAYLSLSRDALVAGQGQQAELYMTKCLEVSKNLDTEQAAALSLIMIRFTIFEQHQFDSQAGVKLFLESAGSIIGSRKIKDLHVLRTYYQELVKLYDWQNQRDLKFALEKKLHELSIPESSRSRTRANFKFVQTCIRARKFDDARKSIAESLQFCKENFGDSSIDELPFLVMKIKCSGSINENRATALRIQEIVSNYPFYVYDNRGGLQASYSLELTGLVRGWINNDRPRLSIDDESALCLARSAFILSLKTQSDSSAGFITQACEAQMEVLKDLNKPVRLMSLYERLTRFFSRSCRDDYRQQLSWVCSSTERILREMKLEDKRARVSRDRKEFSEMVADSESARLSQLKQDILQSRAVSNHPENSSPLAILEAHPFPVETVCFSPDGNLLATGVAGKISIFDARSFKPVRFIDAHQKGVTALVFTGDGANLISCGFDNSINFWNVDTGKRSRFFQEDTNMVRALAVSSDGKFLAAGVDKVLVIWDLVTGETRLKTPLPSPIFHLAWGLDDRVIVVALYDQSMRAVDATNGKVQMEFPGHPKFINDLARDAGGKRLVTACGDRNIRIWDLNTGKIIKGFTSKDGVNPDSVIFSRSGSDIIYGAHGNLVIRVVDSGDVLESIEFSDETVAALAVSPDGSRLAVASGTDVGVYSLNADGTVAPAKSVKRVSVISKSESTENEAARTPARKKERERERSDRQAVETYVSRACALVSEYDGQKERERAEKVWKETLDYFLSGEPVMFNRSQVSSILGLLGRRRAQGALSKKEFVSSLNRILERCEGNCPPREFRPTVFDIVEPRENDDRSLDLDTAIEIYKSWLSLLERKRKDNDQGINEVAEHLIRLERRAGMVAEADGIVKRRLLNSGSKTEKARFELNLASQAVIEGDFQKAGRYWRHALEIAAGKLPSEMSFANLARLYEAKGMPRESEKLSDALLEQPSPAILEDIDQVLQGKVESLISSASLPAAEALVRKRLEAARKLSLDEPGWSIVLAEIFYVTGRKEESKKLFDSIIESEKRAGHPTELIEDRRDQFINRLQGPGQ